MAFRMHDSVLRGEIDNREKGMVLGKIWLAGSEQPLVLELRGNAWPDLAGCLLSFTNRKPPLPHEHAPALNLLQRGTIGDLTASRKVRVFDLPFEEAYAMIKRGEKPPEHMANCLYLEWFSQSNGRVVIESVDYDLKISAPEWRLTEAENLDRAKEAAAGMTDFMGRLNDAVIEHQTGQKSHEEPWDEHDYEKFLKESDARTEKYGELLDKYGDSDEADQKIASEMGWDHDDKETSFEVPDFDMDGDLAEPALDPTREGIDWIRDEHGDITHPLQHRCSLSGVRYLHAVEALGVERKSDSNIDDFIFNLLTTGAKLAGALNPISREQALVDAAFTVACLKRALNYLHHSQAGLEGAAKKNLLPPDLITDARKELFEIREGILSLMDQFRGRGSRGDSAFGDG